MNTPCNKSGETTKMIMGIIKFVLPEIKTEEFNKIYELVYKVIFYVLKDAHK